SDFLRSFWQRQVDAAEQETPDYRHPPLPLARIKKVMKSDPDVKACRSTHPSYFAKRVKVCPVVSFPSQLNVYIHFPTSSHKILHCSSTKVFISEITARAFIIADSNKRRILSRADIAKALAKSDQLDSLIDIVPREEGLTGLTQEWYRDWCCCGRIWAEYDELSCRCTCYQYSLSYLSMNFHLAKSSCFSSGF
ncbi:hypothetical protein F4604DRAFT_1574423, partial [Suillus subluteus]